MERLEDDELVNIFNMIPKDHGCNAILESHSLEYPIDRRSFSRVSKRSLKAACTGLRRLHISLPDLMFDIIPLSSNKCDFRYSKPLSNANIKLLAHLHPNLEFLWLGLEQDVEPGNFDFDFDDEGLCAVAKGCSNLITLELCRRLNVGDVGVVSLVRLCKNLKHLNLDGCSSVTNESLKAIGESSSIRRLVLQGYLITYLGLEYLTNGDLKNRLQKLSLSECDEISDNGILYLKQMVGLTLLDLSNCGVNVSDYGIVGLVSQLPDIEQLDLSWLINVTDVSLSVIAINCLKLEKIYLTGCEAITSKGLLAFACHQTLRHLVLFSCHNFSWEDVECVTSNCIALEYLGVSKRIKTSTPEEITDYCRGFGRKYIVIDWDEDSGSL